MKITKHMQTTTLHLHLLLILPIGFLCNGEQSKSCMQSERLVLVKFKTGLQDPHHLLSSWEGEDCCTWRGVHCDNETWHVVSLDLQSKAVPASRNGNKLGIASKLEEKIRGGDVLISAPSDRVMITCQGLSLNRLDLSSNNFKGTEIPSFFGSLTGLSYLNLSNAGFIGRVPPQLGNLTSLIYLDLNSFYSMHDLHVDDNLHWLSSLSSLQYLDMSRVNLAKISSDNLFHAVNMLPSLSILILPNCHLHWPQPSSSIRDEEDDLDESEMLWLYYGNVVGYVLGLWALPPQNILVKSVLMMKQING
ncbi:receptor-like protein EIX1 [Dioscorea cayenensis subsp. rotundata]|uniref:Receptor-like protein EIX1 n=1 Tax=Dioscorea cayennensis subsp. rotundata TaxID=55577 RepID=A0AB40AYS9_DIOCR|nr:receptor-like protein EIX1 [Dioscorea cayenensis subsp. rotundata]